MLAQVLWQAPRLLPLAVIVAGITIVLVALFYVPQARRLSQPWRWGLPLLRLTVGLMLAASIVQPVLIRSDADADPGAIVLLVDQSGSMQVVDPRPPAQRVALAAALGALPPGVRAIAAPGADDELDVLSNRVDALVAAAGDVDYARLSGQGVIASQARYEELAGAVSTSAAALVRRGQAIPNPSDLGAALTALAAPDAATAASPEYGKRIAAARTTLRAAQVAADAALYERPDVKPICDELGLLSRSQLAHRAMSRGRGGVLAALPTNGLYGYAFAAELQPLPGTPAASRPAAEPLGLRTDLAGAVRAALERMKGRAVQAIVLLSDGRQVGGQDGVTSSLSDAGVPVYSVAVGTPAPRDVSIASASAAARQFTSETSTVRVQLRGTGMRGASAEVKLQAPGAIQTKSVTFDEPTVVVEFPLKLDAPGVHEIVVTATPLDGEVTAANNAVRRRVIATADRAAVALVGASASWDFQHLRAALSTAPWAEVDTEVLDAPGARWSAAPSDVRQRAAVVLSDVAADQLEPRQWDALYRLVAERGASLLFLAGRNTSRPEFIDSPLLTDLLPFRPGSRPAWRTWPGEQPLFRFQPAPEAGDAPPLKLGHDGASTAERWLDLPALFQFLPVTELKPNTRPLLVERESGLPVLTESRLGLGRVLFFGVNEGWRWRMHEHASDHDRFWHQLLRHAIDEPYAVRQGVLRLDADRVTLQPGESVRVRARVLDPDRPPPPDEAIPLAVWRDGVETAPIVMKREAATPGSYGATLSDLAAGTYDLQLRSPFDAATVASLPLHVEADAEAEMRDVSGDERTLRRLAESTGGAFLTLGEWDTLPSRVRAGAETKRRVSEQRLWDSPHLFAFVLGCLGIEWAMRKRLGLA